MRGSITKKGSSYYIVFRRHDPETGKQKQKWIPAGKAKRKAEKMLTELIGQVHDGSYRELVKSTFADFADLWISSYAKTKCKPSP